MNTIWIKKLYKDTIPGLPGYHACCRILRKYRPVHWEWVNRIPVKPGMIVKIHTAAGDLFMGHPERCSIAKQFFWTRGNREPAQDRIALDLFAVLAKSSDVVLDIGASSGLFSLVAARSSPSAQVVAFDILPEAYHTLVDNLMLNGLLDRVESRLVGVGKSDRPFYAPFRRISSQMPTSFSLYCQLTEGDRVLVPVKTLDEICLPRFSGKKMCMKIDVEGAEADIFDQGRETLRLIRPDIICEVLRRSSQVDLCDRILSEHGYKKFLISSEGLRKFDRLEPHDRFRDWFFTTKSPVDLKIDTWANR
jgi:FkbM family methyltransferase